MQFIRSMFLFAVMILALCTVILIPFILYFAVYDTLASRYVAQYNAQHGTSLKRHTNPVWKCDEDIVSSCNARAAAAAKRLTLVCTFTGIIAFMFVFDYILNNF